MKKRNVILLILLLSHFNFLAYSKLKTIETSISLMTATGEIKGTLCTPKKFDKIPIALLIAGSGPTDRDGNNPMMKNNALKLLAFELAKKGIATVRYDKRGIAESQLAGKNENDLRFQNYIDDAKEWIALLKNDKRFSQIIIIGHSEGALIGMYALSSVDKYISLAGAGQSADKILIKQLANQPKEIKDMAFPIIDSLKNGKIVDHVNPMLSSLFRLSVQPYIISWFQHDPQIQLKLITIPILILQGTNDIQITIEDAENLHAANPNSKMVLIPSMNHVLKIVESKEALKNLETYSNPDLPISQELVTNICDFIFAK